MKYAFLVETYATDRVKVVSVWSEFTDQEREIQDHRKPWQPGADI